MTVVCCDRGAPGSTTTALALGAVMPGSLVVEADPYGGDLAVRCHTAEHGTRLPSTPTVLTAVVAARTDPSSGSVDRYAQQLGPGLRVIPGHLSCEQGSNIRDWTPLARSLRAVKGPVVCDVGRIHAASPSMPIAAAADVVVVVSRGDTGAVIHLRERLARLVGALAETRGAPPRVLPVLIVPRRHGTAQAAQLAALLADSPVGSVVTRVGWMAWDPRAVATLEAGSLWPRSSLGRSAAGVVKVIAEMTATTGSAAGAVAGTVQGGRL